MQLSERGAFWVDIFLFAAISVFIYQLGLIYFLFAVPLQILIKKRGEYAYLYAALLVLIGAVVTAFIRTRGMENSNFRRMMALLQLLLPVFLLASLYTVNKKGLRVQRTVFRLIAAVIGAGIVSIPLIFGILRNTEFVAFLRSQLTAIMEGFFSPRAESGMQFEQGLLLSFFNSDRIISLMRELFFRTFLFSFFLILTINWRVGVGISRRIVPGTAPVRLSGFNMPDRFIWVFLLAWAGIIADIFFGLGVFGYVVWNFGLIATFLFGLQGAGILKFFLERSNLGRGLQSFIMVLLVVLFFIPGLNALLLFGIPIFGVSEVWIKYRKPKRSDDQ